MENNECPPFILNAYHTTGRHVEPLPTQLLESEYGSAQPLPTILIVELYLEYTPFGEVLAENNSRIHGFNPNTVPLPHETVSVEKGRYRTEPCPIRPDATDSHALKAPKSSLDDRFLPWYF